MDLVQILAEDYCHGLLPIVQFIRQGIFPIVQIGIPIILIVMGSIDLGKAVLSSDDKEIKGATSKLIKRAIAAVAVFFITTVVTLLFGMFGNIDNDNRGDFEYITGGKDQKGNWSDCWNQAR